MIQGGNAFISSFAQFTNTDTDSADATDDPCLSIRSIRIGSVHASAESGTIPIVSTRSEGKVQNSGADDIPL